MAFFAKLWRRLVWQGSRRRVLSGRVFEEIGIIKSSFTGEGKCGFKILLCFPGKSYDNISRDADLRLNGAKLLHDFEKTGPRITAMHQLQHSITSALHRNMGALAKLRQSPISINQIITISLRMRRGETDSLQPFAFVHCFD